MWLDWEWLCYLVSVPILMVSGHFIWVLLAKLFRAGKAAQAVSTAYPKNDASQTQAHITRLLQAGLIDRETHYKVMTALHGFQRGSKPPPLPVLPMAPPTLDQPTATWPAQPRPAPPLLPVTEPQHDLVAAQSPPMLPPTQPIVPAAVFNPVVSPAPKRPPSEALAAFLRTSNIRWGELIGGFLIIGCSIALVISFWNQIAGKPFFQFGIFTGVTTAMLSLGLYAEHRWKLPTTSRGILLIGTLLVPLNFLGFAALSHGQSASLATTIAEIAALTLFGYLVFVAARTISPFWPGLFTVGVVGASGSLLLTRHLGPATSLPALFILGAAPIGVYAAPIAAMLWQASRWRQVRGPVGDAILLLLGVLTFGAALALGLVLFQSDLPWKTAHDLSPLLSLAAAPSLAAGVLIWGKVTGTKFGRVRTTGTAIGIASAFLMLAAIALAWPDPAGMLPLALLDLIVLTAIAVLLDLPGAHAVAAPCLLLAWLLGFQLLRGHLQWVSTSEAMLQALADPANAPALLPLGLLATAAARFLSVKCTADARIGAGAAVAFLLVAAGLASQDFGRVGDPHNATLVYSVLAVAAIAAVQWTRSRTLAWSAYILLLAAFVQFFITRAGITSLAESIATALIGYATLTTFAAIFIRWGRDRFEPLLNPALDGDGGRRHRRGNSPDLPVIPNRRKHCVAARLDLRPMGHYRLLRRNDCPLLCRSIHSGLGNILRNHRSSLESWVVPILP